MVTLDIQKILIFGLKASLDNQELTIGGDGTSVRDYLYVSDLVDLLMTVQKPNNPASAQTYNASS